MDYQAYYEMTRRYYPHPGWKEIVELSPDSREDLARARILMMQVDPGYRANWLPLQPLDREIAYWVSREVEKSIDIARKLLHR